MNKIQTAIKQLQKNFSELQYDLNLKENQTPNIYDSIECQMVWKRSRTNDIQPSTSTVDASENNDEELHDDSTSSPSSYEHSLLSFLVGNDSSISPTNKDEKLISSDTKKLVSIKKPSTILTNNNKKRRICMNCGKC